MNSRTLTFLLAAVIAVPTLDNMPDLRPVTWEQTTARVMRSLVHLDQPDDKGMSSTCTGFVINSGRALALTAYHCVAGEMPFTVDGQPSYIVDAKPELDLAVVVDEAERKPDLPRRRSDVRYGTAVGAVGYGYSLLSPIFKAGTVANPWVNFVAAGEDDKADAQKGPWVMTDFPFVAGMSGGPIYDIDGRVVGVVLRTDNLTGVTRPMDNIQSLTKKYWN